jgi:hypothetical protein
MAALVFRGWAAYKSPQHKVMHHAGLTTAKHNGKMPVIARPRTQQAPFLKTDVCPLNRSAALNVPIKRPHVALIADLI